MDENLNNNGVNTYPQQPGFQATPEGSLPQQTPYSAPMGNDGMQGNGNYYNAQSAPYTQQGQNTYYQQQQYAGQSPAGIQNPAFFAQQQNSQVLNPRQNVMPMQQGYPMNQGMNMEGKKFCKHCGSIIDKDCIVCPVCGKQVEELRTNAAAQPNIIINNENKNVNTNMNVMYGRGKPRSKWTALLLCLFLGFVGAHKFYDGKVGMGILYLCTMGLFGVGVVIDLIGILLRPNPYYV